MKKPTKKQINKLLILDAFLKAKKFLKNLNEDKALIDSEIRFLICHVLKISNDLFWKAYIGTDILYIDYEKDFLPLLIKRNTAMPISKIIGEKEFCNLFFKISKDVLSPRFCTEILVNKAKLWLQKKDKNQLRVLELGVGSGCNIISIAHTLCYNFPHIEFVGIDICEKALSIANENANLNNVNNITFIKSNWWSCVKGKYDLIISNPPYIPSNEISNLSCEVKDHDPHLSLDGGEDGLECYRIILSSINKFLYDDGLVLLEIGKSQLTEMKKIIIKNNLICSDIFMDNQNIERVIACSKEL